MKQITRTQSITFGISFLYVLIFISCGTLPPLPDGNSKTEPAKHEATKAPEVTIDTLDAGASDIPAADTQGHPSERTETPDTDDTSESIPEEKTEPRPQCTPGQRVDCFEGVDAIPGLGICKFGQKTCQDSGRWGPCVGQVLPQKEVCNGKDDDCDGLVDQDDPPQGAPCKLPKALGPCAQGIYTCKKGDITCKVSYQAKPESCNGVDDDCNGLVDDQYAEENTPCQISGQKGPCANGTNTCDQGKLRCQPKYTATTESCNGKDDDCDGQTDEGLTQPCKTACGNGTQTCTNGKLDCDAPQPKRELCNGKDDDCDGSIDKGFVGENSSCFVTGQRGECFWGALSCLNGKETCRQTHQPIPEQCNGKDDDCDGEIDETCQKHCEAKKTFPTTLTTHTSPIRYLVFHPDKKRYFTSDGWQIHARDSATDKWLASYESPGYSYVPQFSKNGMFMVAGDSCRRAFQWDLAMGALARVHAATDPPDIHGCRAGASLSPDGTTIALSNYNFDGIKSPHWIEFFDTATGGTLTPLWQGVKEHYSNVQYHPGGTSLIYPVTRYFSHDVEQDIASDILNIGPPGSPKGCLRGPYVLSKDGKRATSIGTLKVEVCEWATSKTITSWSIQDPFTIFIDQSDDEKLVLTGSIDTISTIKLWDVATKKTIATFKHPTPQNIRKLDLSPKGDFFTVFAAKPGGFSIEIWDVTTKKVIYTSNFPVYGSTFDPSGKKLYMFGEGIAIWDLSQKKITRNIPNQPKPSDKAKALALKPDGSILAYVWDKSLHVWNLKTSTRIHNITLNATVHSMDFHLTQNKFALLYTDKIEIRDVTTGKVLQNLTGLTKIHQGFFHTNGKEFIANSRQTTGFRFWDINTGKLLRIQNPYNYAPISMNRNGDIITEGSTVLDLANKATYLSGGYQDRFSGNQARYTHVDPTGQFATFYHTKDYGFVEQIVFDMKKNKLYHARVLQKKEDSRPGPYAPQFLGFGSHGKVMVLTDNGIMGVWSFVKKNFVGYTPGLQKNLYLPGSAIATSKDGKVITGRFQGDFFRVWHCP